jgi:hypothetical protein
MELTHIKLWLNGINVGVKPTISRSMSSSRFIKLVTSEEKKEEQQREIRRRNWIKASPLDLDSFLKKQTKTNNSYFQGTKYEFEAVKVFSEFSFELMVELL